uniref:serine/threonine-protein phosphatase PGAM5, mitochondrial-like n=1 Tax=Jaculus jaculus TaxID=51337 RepID=UPI001E1B3D51|nr:serine/threonine-protein phosphatase PGAM5, mitochondrial-like [Jaculus jaculus]
MAWRRRALRLAACGLAGGSAALLFSALAAGELLPGCGRDAAGAGAGPGVWDANWDRRQPRRATATRHLFLVRHAQYRGRGAGDSGGALTPLGRQQAELTGLRLASLGFRFDRLVHSSMSRAVETSDIIGRHLPGVPRAGTDLLREAAPARPDPPPARGKPEAGRCCQDAARMEAAFRSYIHRAEAGQEEDSYEILVGHANVIRYMVCRALQFPPEGWLRLSLNHGSITHLLIRPNGLVALRTLGDTGFMPPDKITRS